MDSVLLLGFDHLGPVQVSGLFVYGGRTLQIIRLPAKLLVFPFYVAEEHCKIGVWDVYRLEKYAQPTTSLKA